MIKLIIFLIIIWQIRTILKKVSEGVTKSNPDESTGKSPGWQDRLREMADKIRTEVEAAQQREKAAPPIPARTPLSGAKHPQAPAAPQRTALRPKPIPPKVEPPPSKPEAWEKQATGPSNVPDAPCGDPHMGRKHRHGSPHGVHDLKQAIVWSEIIAPPLALRDENHPLNRIGGKDTI